jgi:hypothetical protein
VKKLLFLPDGLPFWFDLVEWIRFAAFAHRLTTNGHERTRIHKTTFSFAKNFSLIRVHSCLISG